MTYTLESPRTSKAASDPNVIEGLRHEISEAANDFRIGEFNGKGFFNAFRRRRMESKLKRSVRWLVKNSAAGELEKLSTAAEAAASTHNQELLGLATDQLRATYPTDDKEDNATKLANLLAQKDYTTAIENTNEKTPFNKALYEAEEIDDATDTATELKVTMNRRYSELDGTQPIDMSALLNDDDDEDEIDIKIA